MNIKLFEVVVIRRDQKRGHPSPVYQRADGSGPEFHFDKFPVGACYKRDDGNWIISIWADAAKTLPMLFVPSPNWSVTGDTPETLSCNPSVWVNKPVGWHGYIRNGELVDAP